MKKLKKIIGNTFIILYAILAVTITFFLLSYNKYGNTEIGGYTFVIVDNNEWAPEYNKGDLLLVEKNNVKNINQGDSIFLYKVISNQYQIQKTNVLLKDDTSGLDNEQFIVDGNYIVNGTDIIGKNEGVKVFHNLGTVLSILESRYGFLFLIVIVTLIAFLYELYELIVEVKYGTTVETKESQAR